MIMFKMTNYVQCYIQAKYNCGTYYYKGNNNNYKFYFS